ncbi:MAG: 50S ribosomal protein L10 [Marinilabiliales bacterium]|nr:MAG: 50S ribosomal protein L10 [Marinilabiliales bacterium]
MKREDKNVIIQELTEKLNRYDHFYLTNISDLNAADTSLLRRKCFDRSINLVVVKNTLLRKALEQSEKNFDNLYDVLKDSTSVMFSETANVPAKLIKEFRKTHERPLLKAAFVEESFYFGDDQVDILSQLKSREELIGDIIMLLQSPAKNVVSALQSGGGKLAGIVKTLSEKE